MILRHAWKISGHLRRCTSCFESIGSGQQSLQYRIRGEVIDRELCPCCLPHASAEVRALATQARIIHP